MENLNLDEIVKELKEELLNREMTLLEMDNEAIRIIGDTNSLFESESDCMYLQGCSYYIDYIEKKLRMINVDFDIINKDKEDNRNTIVKVTNIWEDWDN